MRRSTVSGCRSGGRGAWSDACGGVVHRLPVPGPQGVQLMGFGSPGDDAFQHLGKPGHRIHAVPLCCLDQRHRNRPMTCPAVGTGEAWIFAIQSGKGRRRAEAVRRQSAILSRRGTGRKRPACAPRRTSPNCARCPAGRTPRRRDSERRAHQQGTCAGWQPAQATLPAPAGTRRAAARSLRS